MLVYLAPYAVACLLPALIAGLAAWQDWHDLQIANRHSLVLVILFPVLAALSPALHVVPNLLTGLMMLAMGMLLYAARVWGAGDAKLAAALSLYLGWSGLPLFLAGAAISGGVLAVAGLIARRTPMPASDDLKPVNWLVAMRQGGSDLPYAVALAVAAWFVLTQHLLAAYDHVASY